MATAMFFKTDNFQHVTWLIPESQCFTLHSRCKNVWIRTVMGVYLTDVLPDFSQYSKMNASKCDESKCNLNLEINPYIAQHILPILNRKVDCSKTSIEAHINVRASALLYKTHVYFSLLFTITCFGGFE